MDLRNTWSLLVVDKALKSLERLIGGVELKVKVVQKEITEYCIRLVKEQGTLLNVFEELFGLAAVPNGI